MNTKCERCGTLFAPPPECLSDEIKAKLTAVTVCADCCIKELELADAQRAGWIPLSSGRLPEFGVAVQGFNPEWIHEDFNPQGVRECIRNDHEPEWQTAAWNNDSEQWDTTEKAAPTHWQPLPAGPVTGGAA